MNMNESIYDRDQETLNICPVCLVIIPRGPCQRVVHITRDANLKKTEPDKLCGAEPFQVDISGRLGRAYDRGFSEGLGNALSGVYALIRNRSSSRKAFDYADLVITEGKSWGRRHE